MPGDRAGVITPQGMIEGYRWPGAGLDRFKELEVWFDKYPFGSQESQEDGMVPGMSWNITLRRACGSR